MKKTFLSLILMAFGMSSFSQMIYTVGTTDKANGVYSEKQGEVTITGEILNGGKTGTWIETHSGTTVPHFIIQFANDKQEGLFLEFDKQATLLKKVDYKNGFMDGAYYQWYKGGRLARLQHYKTGLLDGESIICYDKGPVQEESFYKEGKRDGVTIWYSCNDREQGSKSALYTYKNGVFEGVQELYDNNGNLKKTTMYSNNAENGDSVEYYEDGSVKSVSKFKNGQQVGKTKVYKIGQKFPEKKE